MTISSACYLVSLLTSEAMQLDISQHNSQILERIERDLEILVLYQKEFSCISKNRWELTASTHNSPFYPFQYLCLTVDLGEEGITIFFHQYIQQFEFSEYTWWANLGDTKAWKQ